MLDVHILKVVHSGVNEARKLIPYIVSCDVYAPENALATEEHANNVERDWNHGFLLKPNRTAFQKAYGDLVANMQDKSLENFNLTRSGYLHRNRVPIISLERFTDMEHASIHARYSNLLDLQNNANRALASLDFDKFFDLRFNFEKEINHFSKSRDVHIAKQIELAEQRIREKFPKFSEKEDINLTIELGGLHSPERYLTIDCSVHDLVDRPNIPLELYEKMDEGASKDDLHKELLANAVHDISDAVLNRSFSQESLASMSLEDLKDWVRENSPAGKP